MTRYIPKPEAWQKFQDASRRPLNPPIPQPVEQYGRAGTCTEDCVMLAFPHWWWKLDDLQAVEEETPGA